MTTRRVVKCTAPHFRAVVQSIEHDVHALLKSLHSAYGKRVKSDATTGAAIVRLLVAAVPTCGKCDYCRRRDRQARYVKRKRAGEKLTAAEAKARRLSGYREWRGKKSDSVAPSAPPATSLRQLAKQRGINYSTLCSRIRDGWTIKKALQSPIGHSRKPHHTLNGETLSLPKWAKRYGISKSTVFSRMQRGMSLEQALSAPKAEENPPLYTFNGEDLSLREWAKRYGLSVGTLRKRIQRGAAIGEALQAPTDPRKRRGKSG